MKNIRSNLKSFRYAMEIIFAASPKLFVIKIFFILMTAVFSYIPIFLWRYIINILTDIGKEAPMKRVEELLFSVLAYSFFFILGKIIHVLSNIVEYKYNDEVDFYLDHVMVERLSAVNLSFFDSSYMMDKANNSWRMIFAIERIMGTLFDIIQQLVRLVGAIVLIYSFNVWVVPLILVFCIPSIIGAKKISNLDYKFEKESGGTRRKMEYYKNLFFEDTYSEISVYELRHFFWSRYKGNWNKISASMKRRDLKNAIINSLSFIGTGINDAIVYIEAIRQLAVKKIAVGDVTYYISLIVQVRMYFVALVKGVTAFQMDAQEIDDVIQFTQLSPSDLKGGDKIPGKNPKVVFEHVFFKYPYKDHYVLEDCSFTLECGKRTGLVGLNGSGKSTIVKLLCRFYDPTEGRILIDDVDCEEYDVMALRKKFGVLFQDYVRYSLSLRENIAISNLKDINNHKMLSEACSFSNVNYFVKGWKKLWDEELTRRFCEEGRELSDGQWQRVALARAFFRNASYVILDEPSASLDPVAEHDLFEKFNKMSQDKGALLISHNLANISTCDMIYVLEDGKIIEEGTHLELMERKGKYAKLYSLQAEKYNIP